MNDDVRAGAMKPPGERRADAPRGAGDEHCATSEVDGRMHVRDNVRRTAAFAHRAPPMGARTGADLDDAGGAVAGAVGGRSRS